MIYIYGATTTLLRQNARINKILRAKFIIQQELNLKFGDFSNLLDFQKPTSKFAPKKIPMVIPPITAHWLRHTYITMLYLAGVDVMTAKEQAGHADIKTTMQIYTHLDSKYKNNQIDKLDEYLSKKGNGCQMGVKTDRPSRLFISFIPIKYPLSFKKRLVINYRLKISFVNVVLIAVISTVYMACQYLMYAFSFKFTASFASIPSYIAQLGYGRQAAMLDIFRKYIPYNFGLFPIYFHTVMTVVVVSQCVVCSPLALLCTFQHRNLYSLGGDLSLHLCKNPNHAHHCTSHRRRCVKCLCYANYPNVIILTQCIYAE